MADSRAAARSAPPRGGEPDDAQVLRSTQLLLAALAMGVLIFGGIALFVAPVQTPLAPVAFGLDPLALAAVLVTLTTAPLAFVLPPRLIEAARERDPAGRAQAFRASRVLAGALCEGPALLWGIALLLSGNAWFLAPLGSLALLILCLVPTRDAYESATGRRLSGT
ncbi:MAG: hypothetical protein JNK02_15015 [Planctomycetes bacterium]|nr:hypothetical protein [Planctomycetota bacterium]